LMADGHRTYTRQEKSSPRVWLRIDKKHIAAVIKARRALCVGEEIRVAR